MNNLLSYCGLVDPRISASDKDLPVRATDDLDGKTTNFYWFLHTNNKRTKMSKTSHSENERSNLNYYPSQSIAEG